MNDYSRKKIDDVVEMLNSIDSVSFLKNFFINEDIEKMESIEKMLNDAISDVENVQVVPLKFDAKKRVSELTAELRYDKVYRFKSSFEKLNVLCQELSERKRTVEVVNSVPLKMDAEKRIIELENEISENNAYLLISDFNERMKLQEELIERKRSVEVANSVPLKMYAEKRIEEIEKLLGVNNVYLLQQNLNKIIELKKELYNKKEALNRVLSVPLKMELEKDILEIEKNLEEYIRIYNELLDKYLGNISDLEEKNSVVKNDAKELEDDKKIDNNVRNDDSSFEGVMKNQEEIYNRAPVEVKFDEESKITKDAIEEFDKLFEEEKKETEEKKEFDDKNKTDDDKDKSDDDKDKTDDDKNKTGDAKDKADDDKDKSDDDKDKTDDDKDKSGIDKHPEIKLNFKRLDEMDKNQGTYVMAPNQIMSSLKDPVVAASTLIVGGNTWKKVTNIKEIPSVLDDKVEKKKPSMNNVNILTRLKDSISNIWETGLSNRFKKNRDAAVFEFNNLMKFNESGKLSEYYNLDPKYYNKRFRDLRKYCSEETFSEETLDELINSVATKDDSKGR